MDGQPEGNSQRNRLPNSAGSSSYRFTNPAWDLPRLGWGGVRVFAAGYGELRQAAEAQERSGDAGLSFAAQENGEVRGSNGAGSLKLEAKSRSLGVGERERSAGASNIHSRAEGMGMESKRVLRRCLLLGVIAAIVGFWVSTSLRRSELQQTQPSNSALPAAKQAVGGYGQAVKGHDAIPRHGFSTTRRTSKMLRRNHATGDVIYGTLNSLPEETVSPSDRVPSPGSGGKSAWGNRRIPDPGVRYRF